MKRIGRRLIPTLVAACLTVPATGTQASEKPQEWEVVNPAGIIAKASVEPAARLLTLEERRLIIISGPVVDKLKLNADTGTAGGENPATNSLSYFINLVGDVVGGSVPPNMDKSTHGSSFDLVAHVICENTKQTPWKQSFAEEQGLTRDDSLVTISTSYLVNANIDHDSVCSEEFMNTFSAGIAGTASGLASCLTVTRPDPESPYNKPLSAWSNSASYVIVVVCPEHADTLFRDTQPKDAIKDYLVKNIALPYKYYTKATCVPPEAFRAV